MYPRFSVYNITFQSELAAKEEREKISTFINHDDLLNEKNYDFILRDGRNLIYVSCDAMIFSEITFSYQEKLEEFAPK
ncbi:MAG: hypothetical protein ACO3EE_05950 [Flavobacteriales bacterium]